MPIVVSVPSDKKFQVNVGIKIIILEVLTTKSIDRALPSNKSLGAQCLELRYRLVVMFYTTDKNKAKMPYRL